MKKIDYNQMVEKYYTLQKIIPKPLQKPIIVLVIYFVVAFLISFFSLFGLGGQKHGFIDATSAVAKGVKNKGYTSVTKAEQCPQHYPFGLPVASMENRLSLCRYNYASLFDKVRKAPIWTSEVVVSNSKKTGKQESQAGYAPDPQVPNKFYTPKSAYEETQGVYERGQMAPEIDSSYDYWGAKESAFVTNTAPQVKKLNRGAWKLLEDQIYEWAQDSKKYPKGLIVYTGPLYLKKTVGLSDGTPIPSHYYKIVMDAKTGRNTAVVLPNVDLPRYTQDGKLYVEEEKKEGETNAEKKRRRKKTSNLSYRLGGYTVTIRQIEKWSGVNFNSAFDKQMADKLETVKDVWLPV